MKNIKKLIAILTLFVLLNTVGTPFVSAQVSEAESGEAQSDISSESSLSENVSEDGNNEENNTSDDIWSPDGNEITSGEQSKSPSYEGQTELSETASDDQNNNSSHTNGSASSRVIRKENTLSNDSVSDLSETSGNVWSTQLNQTLSFACDFLSNSDKGKLYFLCMGASGKTALSRDVTKYVIEASELEADDIIDIEYAVLNTTFCGYDATDIYGRNLVKEIYDYENFDSESINVIAYALLALDSNSYLVSDNAPASREYLTELLTSRQNEDGGFGDKPESESDINSTCLVLTALSGYKNNAEINPIISSAIRYLSDNQQDNAGYLQDNKESLVCAANAVTAIYSLGLSVYDRRFVKNGYTLLDVMLTYLNEDGGFCLYEGGASNTQATEYAVIALNSIKKTASPYNLSNALVGKDSSDKVEKVIEKVKNHKVLLIILIIIAAALTGTGVVVIRRLINRRKKPQDKEEPKDTDIIEIKEE